MVTLITHRPAQSRCDAPPRRVGRQQVLVGGLEPPVGFRVHCSRTPFQYGPTMRAIVQGRYGSVDDLSLSEVSRPEPAADEVLVRVRAASVHPDVWHVVAGRPVVLRLMGSGVRRPRERVPGTDVAGVVESVGSAVTRISHS